VSRKLSLTALIGLTAVLALLAAGCGGGGGGNKGGNVQALPASSCSDIYYEGDGDPDYIISSDLPLQGSGRTQTVQMTEAIKFILKQHDFKAGDYKIGYQSCDDATAQQGKWASEKCSANANAYAQNKSLIGVIGTFNSGCAEIIIPVLNRAPDGPVAMISPANTYVGLTHGGAGTAAGEPDKYYPTGTRNYARVVTSDDVQGEIDANYMKDKLGVTKVFILDDKDAYGKGVADAFEQAANDIGLAVAGHEGWDANAQNYQALMTKVKSSGADGIFIGGISCFNGGQLIKDKVAVVGDNDAVKTVVSDGFVQASLFDEAGADKVEGIYGTAPTLNPEDLPGAGKEFNAKVEQQFGKPEVYTAYAVAALQMLLAALESSDGTREGVTGQLLQAQADTVVGPIKFDENGDPADKFESVFQGKGGNSEFVEQIAAP
jgi:branched-chain amino acid transport system substrate-binding protein